jgi:hypothetical protein
MGVDFMMDLGDSLDFLGRKIASLKTHTSGNKIKIQ